MILFDKLGLAQKSPTNPFKVLHCKFEYASACEYSFVGISNYFMDPGKVNKAFYLAVPNLEISFERVKETAKNIVESISKDLTKDNNMIIFNILSRAYFLYKKYLIAIKKFIALKQYYNKNIKDKEEFKNLQFKEIEENKNYLELLKNEKKIDLEIHQNLDFYNLIKGIAIETLKIPNISDEKLLLPIIENNIERNFGGISYEIDIDFDLEKKDILDDIKVIKNILEEKIPQTPKNKKDKQDKNEENLIKVSSKYLFKKIYNIACPIEQKGLSKQYQIKENNIDKI